jgi:hypothetical protein
LSAPLKGRNPKTEGYATRIPGGNAWARETCFIANARLRAKIQSSLFTIISPLPAALCLLLLFTATAAAEPQETVPVDGQPFEAELVSVDAQWQVAFQEADRRRELPAADLVRWGSCAEIRRGPVVVMADGGLMVADVLEAGPRKIVADSGLFGLVELPPEEVAAIVFRLPADRHAQDLLFDRARSAGARRDEVILANGDVIGGRFRGLRDDVLTLEADVGPLEIETDRVRALVFNPALVRSDRPAGLYAVAGFTEGSRLAAEKLVVSRNSLEITLSGGQTCKTTALELVCLQPFGGRLTYLSDLKPAGSRQLPYLELGWPAYRNDRDVTGGLLRSGGKPYLKGIGVHGADRLTYQLTEPWQRFEARLGIDDRTAGQGSVRFRVYVDGRAEYTSPVVRGGDEPIPVSVDLSGAKRLDLIVDYADRADVMDRADWLEARLVR